MPTKTKGLPKIDTEAAIEQICSRDRKMAKIIERVGPYKLQLTTLDTPFEALAESIIYQQITGKAAATITNRFIDALAPGAFPSPKQVLAATDEELRAIGISRPKVAALRDLSLKSLDGTVPTLDALHAMDDDEIVERLIAVRGIGRWTVEMLLIFRLGRPDVLPIHDYGVRKGFAIAYGLKELPKPEDLRVKGERWRPFRTIASWYLWRATELPAKGKLLSPSPGSRARNRTT